MSPIWFELIRYDTKCWWGPVLQGWVTELLVEPGKFGHYRLHEPVLGRPSFENGFLYPFGSVPPFLLSPIPLVIMMMMMLMPATLPVEGGSKWWLPADVAETFDRSATNEPSDFAAFFIVVDPFLFLIF